MRRVRAGLTTGLLTVAVLTADGFDGGPGWMEDLHGYVDTRAGVRIGSDARERDDSLGETRLQLDWLQYTEAATFQVRSDFLYDWSGNDFDVDLEEGRGWIDLREAYVLFSPNRMTDLKAGRQILTWGTGDLLFINDLFPKDWPSFFLGRDEEYLKAPSDALMVSLFPGRWTVDLVYTPRFDADRFITGERVSYWNSSLGRTAGRDAVVAVDRPDDWFEDDELALRFSTMKGGLELALYGYRGFWKSPAGADPVTGRATFPALDVYGGSVRGGLAGGIANLEAGYYRSRDDGDGDDPTVRNSEARVLVGYQRELARNLNAGIQLYAEHLLDQSDYEAGLEPGRPVADETRQVMTLRLTRQWLQQTLTGSLFLFYSPTDDDGYLRPHLGYQVNDDWQVSLGGNVFFGNNDYTFFGQFEDNSNVYGALRYGF